MARGTIPRELAGAGSLIWPGIQAGLPFATAATGCIAIVAGFGIPRIPGAGDRSIMVAGAIIPVGAGFGAQAGLGDPHG